MKHLLLAFVLLPLSLAAQSWCTPGAEWKYRLTQLGVDFQRHMWYETDVTINGQSVQRIAVRDSSLMNGSQFVQEGYFYSVRIGDVILLRSAGSQYWDTLYYYGAPGQRWWPTGGPDPDCDGYWGMIEIADTCTVFFDGVPRRKWELVYLNELGFPTTDRVDMIEGVGTIPFQLHPWSCSTIAEWYWWEFVSYSDDQISFDTWPAWNACSSIPTYSDEARGDPDLTLFPNPGEDVLTIEGMNGESWRIHIYDGTGRLISDMRSTGRSTTIHTEKLVPGLYTITCFTDNGRRFTQQWSKAK